VIAVLVSAAAGALLGFAFFGALWLTVRRLPDSRAPAAWMVLAYLGRLALLIGGLLLIARGDARRLLGALAGIFLARSLVVRRVMAPAAAAAPDGGAGAG
jgi:F1F0 ATPase subunit 2